MDIYSHVMAGLQEEAAIRFEEALKPRNLEEHFKSALEIKCRLTAKKQKPPTNNWGLFRA